MSLRPSAFGLFLSVTLLAPALSPASAADLEENYGYAEAPQEVPVAHVPEAKIEFGTGWYVRGDLGATTLPDVSPTQPSLGSAPDLQIRQSSKLGYTADLGAGYQILPNFRADLTFDFHEPIRINSSGYGLACPQGYKQVQTGTMPTSVTTSTTSTTASNNSNATSSQNASTSQTSSTASGTNGGTTHAVDGPNSITYVDPDTGMPTSTAYLPITTTNGTTSNTTASTSSGTTNTGSTSSGSTMTGSAGTTSSTTTTVTSVPTYAYNLVNGSCTNQVSSSLTRYDVLVNAYYDLTTWHGITPYVGLGVGLSFGHYSTAVNYFNGDGSSYGADLTNPSTGVTTYYRYDQSRGGEYYNFAYALMAGVAFDVLPHTKIDVGYRYLSEGRVLGVHLYEHQARAGLRYMIDN